MASASWVHGSGLGVTAGAGTGVLAGIGTPEFRLYTAISYTTIRRDADQDGLKDDVDACADQAEDFDGFEDDDGCPDPDNDGDGLADAADGCVDQAEDLDGYEDDDGCPDPDNDADELADADDRCPDAPGPLALAGCPDRDGDGLVDVDDACPEVAGLAVYEGCGDADADGVPDQRDACPDDPKPADEDAARSDGCPKTVYVTAEQIKIEERIEFETGKSKIQSSSLPILDGVRDVLLASPQVVLLEIGGHTDNVGPSDYNRRLSQGAGPTRSCGTWSITAWPRIGWSAGATASPPPCSPTGPPRGGRATDGSSSRSSTSGPRWPRSRAPRTCRSGAVEPLHDGGDPLADPHAQGCAPQGGGGALHH